MLEPEISHKKSLKKCDGVDWIQLNQTINQRRAFEDTVMNLRVPYNSAFQPYFPRGPLSRTKYLRVPPRTENINNIQLVLLQFNFMNT